MVQQLRINDSILSRTFSSKIRRSTSIPTTLPAAERVVSVSARVEMTSVELERGFVVINGIIRSHIYYAAKDEPSNVLSFRRNFQFSERIAVSEARRGLEVDIDMLIADIEYTLINNRSIELIFTISTDIDLFATERVTLVDERKDIQVQRREMRVQRTLRESRFERTIQDTLRIPTRVSDISRVLDVDSTIQILESVSGNNRVRVRGIVKSDLLYFNASGKLEYAELMYEFNEVFSFTGARPEMDAFVEVNVVDERVTKLDRRRVKIRVDLVFTILVVEAEVLDVPTDIVKPVDKVFPVRRPVLVEEIVAERRSRISARTRVTLAEGKPDVASVISASGTIRGGSIVVAAENGGVALSGVIDANVIYVGDLPQQPVHHTSATINFDSFINIPEVRAGMQVYSEISVNRITATRVSARVIEVRAVVNVELLITERKRVPVVTDITDRPVRPVEKPIHRPAVRDDKIQYTVRTGDSLYTIAREHSVTVEQIISLNPGIDPNRLQIGQKIWIPRN
ncbi:DUF3794 and LysM peptidoglycan-binding domain-containing protein [Natronospora cellulosivora (SeqCode)]